MNVLFFGSSNYCLPILETLFEKCTLVGIVTKPSSSAFSFALLHHIPVFTPQNNAGLLNLQTTLKNLEPDVAIVADYGLIIPPEIFTIPKNKTLNIHFSKLPKLRGASPVQFTLLTGEKSAWVTIILMDETLDTGDIIWQEKITRLELENETGQSLYTKLFQIMGEKLPTIITDYTQGKLHPQKQNEKEATYTKTLTRQDGFIPGEIIHCALNNLQPSQQVFDAWPLTKIIPEWEMKEWKWYITRAVRAFSPWPGVWTTIQIAQSKNEKRLKILKAHLEPITKLVLDLVQLEGKNPVTFSQLQKGYPNLSFM